MLKNLVRFLNICSSINPTPVRTVSVNPPQILDGDGAVSQPVPDMQKPSEPPEPPDNTEIKSSPRPQRERHRPTLAAVYPAQYPVPMIFI